MGKFGRSSSGLRLPTPLRGHAPGRPSTRPAHPTGGARRARPAGPRAAAAPPRGAARCGRKCSPAAPPEPRPPPVRTRATCPQCIPALPRCDYPWTAATRPPPGISLSRDDCGTIGSSTAGEPERSSEDPLARDRQNRTYHPVFEGSALPGDSDSGSPYTRSDLRIPPERGTLQHVTGVLVKPRDMP